MKRADLQRHCLALPGAVEDFPFGVDVAVLKVMNKMFALLPVEAAPCQISLKCDPNEGEMLRATYAAITPGYHLNKRHWITVVCDGTIPAEVILGLIDDSYALVVKSLKKAERAALQALDTGRDLG